jgi:hypothetical protein
MKVYHREAIESISRIASSKKYSKYIRCLISKMYLKEVSGKYQKL